MKRLMIILLILVLGNCASREDKNYLWLMSILAPSGNATSDATPNPALVIPTYTTPSTTSTETTTFSFNASPIEVQGDPNFYFSSTESIPVWITFVDAVSPSPTALVQIFDFSESPSLLLYQATPDSNGNVKGSFTINKNKPFVTLVLTVDGVTTKHDFDLTWVKEVSTKIRVAASISPHVVTDKDGDDVVDDLDAYPDDPTRASKILVPGTSFTTVAFEDLYPAQGDADFNDYVVRVNNEEDLDANGKTKRIRGTYEHIAKGAGYNHTLNLQIPTGVTGTYTLKRYGYDGLVEYETAGNVSSTILLLPDSNTTLPSWNSRKTDTFKKGKKSEIEIILDTPMIRTTMGVAPYDLFLKVLSTNKEIHFSGKYKKADGSDTYLDAKGFPWAIAIPGTWKHPYEKTDIRTSYSFFKIWYESLGTTNNNWYESPNSNHVFPIP